MGVKDAEMHYPDIHQLRRYAFTALVMSCVLTILIVTQGWFLLNLINRADLSKKTACDFYARISTISTSGDPQLQVLVDDAKTAYKERGCTSHD